MHKAIDLSHRSVPAISAFYEWFWFFVSFLLAWLLSFSRISRSLTCRYRDLCRHFRVWKCVQKLKLRPNMRWHLQCDTSAWRLAQNILFLDEEQIVVVLSSGPVKLQNTLPCIVQQKNLKTVFTAH